ncbi:MAG: DUF4410 domain-containing protein [Blastocatellales bacterium]
MSRNAKIISCLLLLIALSAVSPVTAQTKTGKLLSEYNAIVVEAITLDKNPALAKFPAGHDTDLQKKIVADLRKKNVFPEVIDGTRQAGEQEPSANGSNSGKRLILSTTIIDFNPGNKALRYTVGWGLGATKVKARFIFRDAATGQELWVHTQQGKFAGFLTLHGTGKNYPVTEASGDIVDALIKQINKHR